MLSVVTPITNTEPYRSQAQDLSWQLKQQSVPVEHIIEIQKEGGIINKNKLLNKGIKKAKSHVIWLADADLILTSRDLLERMALWVDLYHITYPVFETTGRAVKICDGSPMFARSAIEDYGDLDETLKGVRGVSFPFLRWSLDRGAMVDKTCKIILSDQVIKKYGNRQYGITKTHSNTVKKTKEDYNYCIAKLIKMGVWPE